MEFKPCDVWNGFWPGDFTAMHTGVLSFGFVSFRMDSESEWYFPSVFSPAYFVNAISAARRLTMALAYSVLGKLAGPIFM